MGEIVLPDHESEVLPCRKHELEGICVVNWERLQALHIVQGFSFLLEFRAGGKKSVDAPWSLFQPTFFMLGVLGVGQF